MRGAQSGGALLHATLVVRISRSIVQGQAGLVQSGCLSRTCKVPPQVTGKDRIHSEVALSMAQLFLAKLPNPG